MSRGPGRIERAIRALFDAHPDLAFVTDEIVEHCYPKAERVSDKLRRVAAIELRLASDRSLSLINDPALAAKVRHRDAERLAGPGVLEFPPKYQVAVIRAAKNVIARDPDWSMHRSESQGGTWTFFNRANAQSWAMASVIGEWRTTYRSPKRIRRYDRANSAFARYRWTMSHVLKDRDEALKRAPVELYESHVAKHIAHRDGDAATRAAMDAEAEAGRRVWMAAGQALMSGKRLEAVSDAASKHLELAALARRLITENDPDAVRSGLAEIADALDAFTAPATPP